MWVDLAVHRSNECQYTSNTHVGGGLYAHSMEAVIVDRAKQRPRNWHRAPCLAHECSRAAAVNGGGICTAHQDSFREIVSRELGARVARVRIDRSGYVHVLFSQPGIWHAAHRWVMEQRLLGRPLLAGENVHHINGNRGDNRPDNLELWVSAQPSGQRPDDLAAYARQLLGRYGTDAERAAYGD